MNASAKTTIPEVLTGYDQKQGHKRLFVKEVSQGYLKKKKKKRTDKMSCKCARRDLESGGWRCEVSGDACMYFIPNSKRCAEDFGEGPDAWPEDEVENDAEV